MQNTTTAARQVTILRRLDILLCFPEYKDKKEYRENVYRLSSYTCLAGDIIGDYKFDSKINIGDRLVFEDMAIYSMVKNNTFNGIPLPAIAVMKDKEVRVIKEFGYEDFKWRLS